MENTSSDSGVDLDIVEESKDELNSECAETDMQTNRNV